MEYTRYIPLLGIYMVYTWYIPTIYLIGVPDGRLALVPVGSTRTLGQCHLRCEENLLNFLALPVKKHRTLGTDAGSGMSTAWPFREERSNSAPVGRKLRW